MQDNDITLAYAIDNELPIYVIYIDTSRDALADMYANPTLTCKYSSSNVGIVNHETSFLDAFHHSICSLFDFKTDKRETNRFVRFIYLKSSDGNRSAVCYPIGSEEALVFAGTSIKEILAKIYYELNVYHNPFDNNNIKDMIRNFYNQLKASENQFKKEDTHYVANKINP